jgi:hypothetical protein
MTRTTIQFQIRYLICLEVIWDSSVSTEDKELSSLYSTNQLVEQTEAYIY